MILITGATGRVGRELVYALQKNKKFAGKISLLVRDVAAAKKIFGPKITYYESDLNNDLDNAKIAKACNGVDNIIHLAGLIDYSASESQTMAVNFGGTARLLNAAKMQRKKPRILFLSSTSIYRGINGKINENTPPRPINAYGKSKLASEKAIMESGLNFVIIRSPLIYGSDFKTGFSLIIRAIKSGKMPIIGFGKNVISYIHISDLVCALILCLESKLKSGTFIVSSGESKTQKELYTQIAKMLNVSPPGLHVPKFVVYSGAGLAHSLYRFFGKTPKVFREYVDTLADNREYDISKARKILHFQPKVPLEQGIKGLIFENK